MTARVLLLAGVLLGLAAGSAGASFPGSNGLIAYSTKDPGSDRCCFLTTIRPDGTGKLVFGYGGGSWSPDGSLLAFSGREGGIQVMAPDGGDRRRLTDRGDSPAWSPDGRSIVYAAVTGTGPGRDLYVVPTGGGEPRRLTSGPGDDVAPDWSPDGTLIAYSYDGALWTIAPEGTGARRLVAKGTNPSWSPDGKLLAFDRSAWIYVVARDGGGERRLRTGVEPAWSPDGRRLAFTWRGSLCVAGADGRDARVVDRGANYDVLPPGGIHADWQPRPGGPSLRLSRSSCERPVSRFSTSARPKRRLVRPGGRVTFAVSVRNSGPDTGKVSFDYEIAGAIRALTDEATVGACGRGSASSVSEWRDGVYVPAGACLSIRVSVSAAEPGRIHLIRIFPRPGRVLASAVVTGCTILGTVGDDVLRGTRQRDVICGDLGDDVIRGEGGADLVYGAGGVDRIEGGPGRDTLVGGLGRDDLEGGAEADVLRGGATRFSMGAEPEEDRDRLRGGPGDDLLDGGDGVDVLRSGAGDDVVLARDGFQDSIDCAAGHDRAYVDAVTRTRPERPARCELVQRG